jgi:putative transposase
MARPLSIDLRERAVAAVLKGGLSRHRAAAQFGVAASTVINWVRRFQETGSVAPGQMGGHKAKGHCRRAPRLSDAADQGTRFTLRGLAAELAERGLKVDYRSVWNFVHVLATTREKPFAGRSGSAGAKLFFLPKYSPDLNPEPTPPRNAPTTSQTQAMDAPESIPL